MKNQEKKELQELSERGVSASEDLEILQPEPVTIGVTYTGHVAKLESALAGAVAKFGAIHKGVTGTIGNRSFKYADLPTLVRATRPALSEAGIIAYQLLSSTSVEGLDAVVLVIAGHGGRISCTWTYLPQSDVKELGKNTTYRRRYQYQSFLMLDGDDLDADADGGRTSSGATRPAPKKQAAPPKKKRGGISDEQGLTIRKLAVNLGMRGPQLLACMTEATGVTNRDDLTRAQAKQFITYLEDLDLGAASSAELEHPSDDEAPFPGDES